MDKLIGSVPGVNRPVLDFPICLIDLARIRTDNLVGPPDLRALLDALQSASENRLSERFELILSTLAEAGNSENMRELMRALTLQR